MKKMSENQKSHKSKLADLKKQLIKPVQIVDNEPVINEEDRPLEPRQLLFIEEYLKDYNGTQAAIRAGYSERTANVKGSQLLTKINIKNEILRRQSLISKATNITIITATEDLLKFIQELYSDEKIERSVQLKAMELIYKLNGLFNDQTNINIQNNFNEIKVNIVKNKEIE